VQEEPHVLMSKEQDLENIVEGTGAEILVESLHRAGIKTIFGLSGDTGVVFYDALYHRRDRIRHVMTRDERHAAFMADVYARCTNKVGVVEVSSGGGATYLVGGLGEPFASSVPMLIITSDIHSASRGTGALTEIDQDLLFAAVTKWRATVQAAAEIPRLVTEALTAATSGRPGPTCLIVPEDVFEECCRVTIPKASIAVPRERSAADDASIHRAAEALRLAKRPVIVAGSGVHLSEAWPELARVAETSGIPVATTIHGKGTFPEGSPWSLGVVGANGARDYANEYLAEADVVLFVGTRANATDTNSYASPSRDGTTVIQNDIEVGRAGRNFPGSIALAGDAKATLAQLIKAAPQDEERRQRLRSWIETRRQVWYQSTLESEVPNGQALLDPRDVVRTIREEAGADVLVVADAGTPTPNVAAYWETERAARTIIIPRGHGPMGYAIPGAIGAALAFPDRPIVALTTDGSFAMSCGELETARRLDLPIVYVHFDNGSMGWIKMLQHLYMDRRYFSVDPGWIDAAVVAQGMGLDATRVTNLEEFSGAFKEGLTSRGPIFIDVPVPDQISLVPPVAPWHAALAGETERPVY
jgi:acetolactate synthase I/II/III large subunit